MAIKLTDEDHRALHKRLDGMMAVLSTGELSPADVRSILAHLICAAAVDNSDEVEKWLHAPETLMQWKNDFQSLRAIR